MRSTKDPTHIHDIDCGNWYQSEFGGWILVCDYTQEIYHFRPVKDERTHTV